MRDLRYFGDTCAVAISNGKLVGWCWMIPAPGCLFFLHQLGVSPDARGTGIADALVRFQLNKLGACHGLAYRLESTVGRNNRRSQELFRKVAETSGMRLEKLPDTIRLLEKGCEEELYVMTPLPVSTTAQIPDMQIHSCEMEAEHAHQ